VSKSLGSETLEALYDELSVYCAITTFLLPIFGV